MRSNKVFFEQRTECREAFSSCSKIRGLLESSLNVGQLSAPCVHRGRQCAAAAGDDDAANDDTANANAISEGNNVVC